MVDASAAAGAAKWIATALIEEAKYLYGAEDHIRRLHNDLEFMKEFLQIIDKNPRLVKEEASLRLFTREIRELAFRNGGCSRHLYC